MSDTPISTLTIARPFTSKVSAVQAPSKRVLELDILRGVAILLVLFRHPITPVTTAGGLTDIVFPLYRIAWTGVDLFFVLSGYLIGGLLLAEITRTGTLDVKRFWTRRAFKIAPPYIAYLAFAAGITAWENLGHGALASLKVFTPTLVHIQNYIYVAPVGHTWSLAVEEHFYFVLPLIFLLLLRRKRLDAIPWIALSAAVVCTAMRIYFNGGATQYSMEVLAPTHLRFDSLMWGVFLSYLARIRPAVVHRLTERRPLLAVVGLLLIVPMMVFEIGDTPFVWTVGYTMLYVGYGCILLAFIGIPMTGPVGRLVTSRFARPVAWVGTISYGVYLVHITVMYHLMHHPLQLPDGIGKATGWMLVYVLYIVISILLGKALTWLVERPALAVRERFFPAVS